MLQRKRREPLKAAEWGSLLLRRVRGVTRTAILLGILTALGSLGIGSLAYITSRETTLKHVYESNLNLARTIGGHALLSRDPSNEVLGDLETLWEITKTRYRGSYLCVVGPSGQLLVHTARPERLETNVGAIPIDSHSARDPKNLLELVEAKQDWAGYYTSPDGQEQVAAFVYVDRLNALVGVHVPAAEIEAEIRAAALPWAVGLMFITVVLLPLSLGLLHWGYTTSERAAGRAMAELRESEGRLRAIFENSAIGIALTDLTGRFVVTNRAYQAMLGYSEEELRRLSCGELALEEYFEINNRSFTELIEGKRQYFQIEKQYRRKDGKAIWARDTVSLIPDPEGKPQFAIALIEDITERKRAEEALKRSEERFKAQYKGIPIPTYTWRKVGEDYILIDCNDAAAVFTHGVEDLIGSRAKELYEDSPDILDDFSRCGAARPPIRREMRYRMRSTGATVDLIVTYACVPPDLVMVHTEDISTRKRAEEEVRLSQTIALSVSEAEDLQSALEVTLRKVCEATGWALGQAWVPHPDGTLLECSPAWHATAPGLETFRRITEASAFSSGNGLPGRVWASKQAVWVRDVTKDKSFLRAPVAKEVGLKAGMAVPVLAGDEVVAVLEFFVLEHRAEDERLLQLVSGVAAQLGTVIHRKRAEDALRKSEEKYRLLMEQASDGITIGDQEMKYVEVNSKACDLLGYTREELLRLSAKDLIPQEDLAITPLRLDDLRAGNTVLIERRLRRSDGTLIRAEVSAKMLEDGRFQAIIRDITERKQAEDALKARARQQAAVAALGQRALSRIELSTLMDEAAALVARTLDADYSKILELLPDGRAFVLRAGVGWMSPPGKEVIVDAGMESQAGFTLRSNEPVIVEDLRSETRFSGPPLLHDHGVTSGISIIINGGEKPFGVLGAHTREWRLFTQQDIHFLQTVANILATAIEAKRAEEALRQSEKLAAMGSLLASVAHEMNNPLSVVIGHAFLLRQEVEEGAATERAEKIAQAAERCMRIVKNFLALARHRPPERRPVRLNQVVEEAVELLDYQLRMENIAVTLDLAQDLPLLSADPHQLHQVVVNLISNAYHALRGSTRPRRLIFTTRFDPVHERASLEVRDTGPGIPPEIRPRIFEPFFTTKPQGQGTGLGLSLCKGIVEIHGGAIRLENPPGRGTLFRVELPVETTPIREPNEEPAVESLARGRILVVDDEPEVLVVLRDLLSRVGHKVETAANGAEALEKLGGQTYDVIVADLRMPELDGRGLYREMEHQYPSLVRKVVFITGDSLSFDTQEFLERTGAPTVNKPFALEEVQRVVQQLLARG